MRALLVFLTSLLILVSPTHAKRGESVMIVGYLNPDFQGRTVKKIMVNVKNADFFYTDQIEIRVEGYIEDESDEKVDVVQFHRTFPPVKKFTDEEIEAKITELGIDAVLFISILGDDESVSTGWSFRAGGGSGFHGASGGSSSTKFRSTSAVVELIDVKTKKLIWGGKGKFVARGDSKRSYVRNSKRLGSHIADIFEREKLYPVDKDPAPKSSPAFTDDDF